MKHVNATRSIFTLLLLVVIASFFNSCKKADAPGNDTSEPISMYAMVKNHDYSDPANTARAPRPGSDPIAQIAIANGGFSQLVDALMYVDQELNAGLVNMFMNGTDQYTVFAPTDAAFNNLYTALNITSVRDLPASLVLQVLQYHVTEGRRAANSVVPTNGFRTITTLLPNASFDVYPNASIDAIGNTANIIMPNISASNGIIHVIDNVLLPIQ